MFKALKAIKHWRRINNYLRNLLIDIFYKRPVSLWKVLIDLIGMGHDIADDLGIPKAPPKAPRPEPKSSTPKSPEKTEKYKLW